MGKVFILKIYFFVFIFQKNLVHSGQQITLEWSYSNDSPLLYSDAENWVVWEEEWPCKANVLSLN